MVQRALFLILWLQMASGSLANPPVDTSAHFPLVGGSTYHYRISGGQYATRDTTYSAGATWGARGGLVEEENRYTCTSGRICAAYTRMYYAQEAEGVRYYGFYGEFPSGARETQILTTPELRLKDPVTPGRVTYGAFGPRIEDAETWDGVALGTSAYYGEARYNWYHDADALETVVTPVGTFANALRISGSEGGSFITRWYVKGIGIVRWQDSAGNDAVLTSYYIPATQAPEIRIVRAVEFYHAELDHYFISADPAEINGLDTGFFRGWTRTGYSFNVVAADSATPPGASPVCRYYGFAETGLNSHFYSASPVECSIITTDYPEWTWESSNVFQVYLPNTTTGACPANTSPIYRVFNRRRDANHRYMTVPSVVDEMVRKGGVAEGYGPGPYYPVMCSPE